MNDDTRDTLRVALRRISEGRSDVQSVNVATGYPMNLHEAIFLIERAEQYIEDELERTKHDRS